MSLTDPCTPRIRTAMGSALARGFGIETPQFFDLEKGTFLSTPSVHCGISLLRKLVDDPSCIKEILDRANDSLNAGVTLRNEYARCVTSEADFEVCLRCWAELVVKFYESALDQVLPDEFVKEIIRTLTGAPDNDPSIASLFFASDGRNTLSHRAHGLLLHFAHQFRRYSAGAWGGTYDTFDREWLNLHFTPLSGTEAYDLERDRVAEAIASRLNVMAIPIEIYRQPESNPVAAGRAAQIVREELREMNAERLRMIHLARLARADLVARCQGPDEAECVDVMCRIIPEAIRLNEEIHQQICIAANLLRMAAKRRGIASIHLEAAFKDMTT